MFYKQTETFIKIVSKLRFANLASFMRKFGLCLNGCFRYTFRDTTTAWYFGVSKDQIPHLQ